MASLTQPEAGVRKRDSNDIDYIEKYRFLLINLPRNLPNKLWTAMGTEPSPHCISSR
jgi:hypothetical protein